MKKTKIIATIGPATSDRDIISKMISSGMNIARINMSHTGKEDVKKIVDCIREESRLLDINVSILMDLCGPKIRVGFPMKDKEFTFKEGQRITIGAGDVDVPLNQTIDFNDMPDNSIIKIDDGKYSFTINSFNDGILEITSNESGKVTNGKGVNFPGIPLKISAVTDKDLMDLELALDLDIDLIALSFIR